MSDIYLPAKRDLDVLDWACERLEDVFGLYVAPVLAERLKELDPDVDDDAEGTATWICRLTRALDTMRRAHAVAFGPASRGERDALEEQREADGFRWGEARGRVLGAAEERAARLAVEGDEGEIRRALRRMRPGRAATEPWERALW